MLTGRQIDTSRTPKRNSHKMLFIRSATWVIIMKRCKAKTAKVTIDIIP